MDIYKQYAGQNYGSPKKNTNYGQVQARNGGPLGVLVENAASAGLSYLNSRNEMNADQVILDYQEALDGEKDKALKMSYLKDNTELKNDLKKELFSIDAQLNSATNEEVIYNLQKQKEEISKNLENEEQIENINNFDVRMGGLKVSGLNSLHGKARDRAEFQMNVLDREYTNLIKLDQKKYRDIVLTQELDKTIDKNLQLGNITKALAAVNNAGERGDISIETQVARTDYIRKTQDKDLVNNIVVAMKKDGKSDSDVLRVARKWFTTEKSTPGEGFSSKDEQDNLIKTLLDSQNTLIARDRADKKAIAVTYGTEAGTIALKAADKPTGANIAALDQAIQDTQAGIESGQFLSEDMNGYLQYLINTKKSIVNSFTTGKKEPPSTNAAIESYNRLILDPHQTRESIAYAITNIKGASSGDVRAWLKANDKENPDYQKVVKRYAKIYDDLTEKEQQLLGSKIYTNAKNLTKNELEETVSLLDSFDAKLAFQATKKKWTEKGAFEATATPSLYTPLSFSKSKENIEKGINFYFKGGEFTKKGKSMIQNGNTPASEAIRLTRNVVPFRSESGEYLNAMITSERITNKNGIDLGQTVLLYKPSIDSEGNNVLVPYDDEAVIYMKYNEKTTEIEMVRTAKDGIIDNALSMGNQDYLFLEDQASEFSRNFLLPYGGDVEAKEREYTSRVYINNENRDLVIQDMGLTRKGAIANDYALKHINVDEAYADKNIKLITAGLKAGVINAGSFSPEMVADLKKQKELLFTLTEDESFLGLGSLQLEQPTIGMKDVNYLLQEYYKVLNKR